MDLNLIKKKSYLIVCITLYILN